MKIVNSGSALDAVRASFSCGAFCLPVPVPANRRVHVSPPALGPQSGVLVTSRRLNGSMRRSNYLGLPQKSGVLFVICAQNFMLFRLDMCGQPDIFELRVYISNSSMIIRTYMRKLGINQAVKVPHAHHSQRNESSENVRGRLSEWGIHRSVQPVPSGPRTFLLGPHTRSRFWGGMGPMSLSGPHQPQEV